MQLSEEEILQLKMLQSLLNQTFRGALFGDLKIDNCVVILDKVIKQSYHSHKYIKLFGAASNNCLECGKDEASHFKHPTKE